MMKIDKWEFDTAAQSRLEALTSIVSPTMEEMPMANHLRTQWGELTNQVKTDVMGNVYASLVGTHPLQVGMVAHIDTVALQITYIQHGGYLQFRCIGLRPHVLAGQPVSVLTANGVVQGVVGFDPTSQYGQPKGLIEDDLWIDLGVNSYKEVSALVQIGDLAVLTPRFSPMGDKVLCATAIDNHIGVFAISECLRWFASKGSPVCLHAIGSVQEEIALRGAELVPFCQPLDACFVVDVDYATDTPTPHNNQMGELTMGCGAGLHRKADNNPVLQRIAREAAAAHNIHYQTSVGRYVHGGTDATVLQRQLCGVATLNINIPCRYMHSPVEMCHKEDVESVINLLIATIERIAQQQQRSFIPGID